MQMVNVTKAKHDKLHSILNIVTDLVKDINTGSKLRSFTYNPSLDGPISRLVIRKSKGFYTELGYSEEAVVLAQICALLAEAKVYPTVLLLTPQQLKVFLEYGN